MIQTMATKGTNGISIVVIHVPFVAIYPVLN
jgi:hypothetical protein